MAAQRHVGPGIAKVRHPSPHRSRVASLTYVDDALWALLFDSADILSEGTAEREGDQLVYRGSTSIILPVQVLGGSWDAPRLSSLAQIASADPHLRLRAVRIARTEAHVRSPGALEPAHMDLVVRSTRHGVRIDVEVDAVVHGLAVRFEERG